MLGAIVGDIVGSVYEWHNIKTKEFPLFRDDCFFTDDTVMTCAVAEAIMNGGERDDFIDAMKKYGRMYPDAGYGGRFNGWIFSDDRKPYNSFGNGSAMRVSPCGWMMDPGFCARTGMWPSNGRARAKLSAEVTHNHPEGVKGAESIASVIWLARNGKSKEEIKDYVITEFGYDLSRTCDEIRPNYRHVESCQETCPEAITAFLEGEDFEDVIRTAVSLGGDCDTLTDIATAMAEAFYGLPEKFEVWAYSLTTDDMHEVMQRFDEKRAEKA